MVRGAHIDVCLHHPGVLVVPPEPVASASPCPVGRVASDQHEVVRVRPHKPHVGRLGRHTRLVVEATHVTESDVGDPGP